MRRAVVGLAIAVGTMLPVVACSSSKGEVSVGGTEVPQEAQQLACAGGGVSGISPDFASGTGEATPEAAIAAFTKYEKAIPEDGYSPVVDPSTATTQVPTATYHHLSDGQVDVELRLISSDGTTWHVDNARYCP